MLCYPEALIYRLLRKKNTITGALSLSRIYIKRKKCTCPEGVYTVGKASDDFMFNVEK
jgi:hypothetical protein